MKVTCFLFFNFCNNDAFVDLENSHNLKVELHSIQQKFFGLKPGQHLK